jgi:hypothetical protein
VKRPIILLTALLLTGCGWQPFPPVTGTVIDREHEAGEWDTKRKCTTKLVNGVSKQVCENKREWDSPDYSLTVKDSEGRTHTLDVSETEYHSHPIGSTYTNG